MKIWIISDTHCKHGFLDIPDGIDMAIHGGDMSNQKSPAINANEVLDFLEWYKSLTHIKYKILIAGNHDTSIEKGLVARGDMHESIIYLEHESVTIEGIKIFGSPYTPKFGTDWAYNVPKEMIASYWDDIPDDTDILITHGPPKGILDLTQYDTRTGYDRAHGGPINFFQCGCKELLNRVKAIQPKYHIFGHIHPETNCPNSAMLKINGYETTFINAAVCDFGRTAEDVKVKQIANNGFIIEIEI